jgi:hypothetical protein
MIECIELNKQSNCQNCILRRTVVVLRSVGETAVIRFRCVSQPIEQFGGPHEGKVKRYPVTSATVARVRIDDERAGPPPSPIQTYKQLTAVSPTDRNTTTVRLKSNPTTPTPADCIACTTLNKDIEE